MKLGDHRIYVLVGVAGMIVCLVVMMSILSVGPAHAQANNLKTLFQTLQQKGQSNSSLEIQMVLAPATGGTLSAPASSIIDIGDDYVCFNGINDPSVDKNNPVTACTPYAQIKWIYTANNVLK